jgi:hypothetical protein
VLWTVPNKALIFVPAHTLSSDAILGEAGNRLANRKMVSGFGKRQGFQYPSRPLEGLKTVPMRELPPSVTEPAGTVTVSREFDGYARERLLREYYGDYQRGNAAAVTEFVNMSDHLDARVVAQIIAVAMSVEHHIQTRIYHHPEAMIFGDKSFRGPKFHGRVNSRDGKVHIETAELVPHVVKALLLVAASSLPIDAAAQSLTTGNIAVKNSEEQEGPDIVGATKNALADYATSAGLPDLKALLQKLRTEVEQNEGSIDGSAEF